jgi:hypothetical protein
MKPRTLQTVKILAVALTAAGCTRPVRAEVSADTPVQPEAPAAPVAVGGAVQAPVPPSDPPIPPLPPDPAGKALVDLAVSLDEAGPEKALQDVPRFRPLCDKDGYPLVGNVMGKGHHGQPYVAAAFCSDVRKKARP